MIKITSWEKETLLREILERVEDVSRRRDMRSSDTQAITESIRHLFKKKLVQYEEGK
jgi:hypothetical protein